MIEQKGPPPRPILADKGTAGSLILPGRSRADARQRPKVYRL
jgi:hypothetical protein